MRDKEGRQWVDAARVVGDRTMAKVTEGIQEGHEYEFRVVAVNRAGPSEPSDVSKSVIAKPRFRKYIFDHLFRRPLVKTCTFKLVARRNINHIKQFVAPTCFRTVAPHIDRKNLHKKVMRVGQMLRIEADIIGEPPPIVTWKLKDAVLKSMDRLKIENEDYHTTFIMSKLQRSDTGTYTVIAKNDSGTDQVDVEIQVCELFHDR